MSAEFSRPRPLLLRLWHAFDGLVILGLLGTVFLRKTFLAYRTNGPLIEAKVAELGGTVSTEGATAVAKLLRDRMWEWHHTFGIALLVLVAVRIVVILLDHDQSPIRSLLHAFAHVRGLPAAARTAALHPLLVKLTHVTFYGLLLVMSVSGAAMLYKDTLGIGKDLVETIKETHELLMWGIAAFVPMHVLGVVVAELRGERGLVSEMIHGAKP